MFISYNWLKDYVDLELSPQELADRLTMAGVAVENVTALGQGVDGVVVGRIESISPHPGADKLVITKVDTGSEKLQIVTAATNVAAGDVIPVALEGAVVASGLKIKKAKLRGVESRGMMCSGQELGIDPNTMPADQAHGIMILPPDTPLGVDAKEAVGVNDYILELDLTPNRGDCLSVIGVAREVAALTGKPFRLPEPVFSEIDEDVAGQAQVDIADPELCRRYVARLLRNIKIAQSPLWMQARLRAAGMRPINNIVDVTNYVMLEMGQPLHAFDYDKLAERHIIVRRAAEREEMLSLDGTQRVLTPEMLVIADPSGPVCIAGVMGGLTTEITEDTTSMLLEAAYFNPVSIRRTSKNLGLRSEASLRFEKGIDQGACLTSINRAVQLICEMNAGVAVKGAIDNHIAPPEEKIIALRPERVNYILGIDVPRKETIEILKRLQFTVNDSGDALSVTVPSYRVDVGIEEDLIEEVARMHGFDLIPSTLPTGASGQGGKTGKQAFKTTVADTLASFGLNEIITYSFTHPGIFDRMKLPGDSALRQGVKIKNPLSEDRSLMRTMLLPGILEALAKNYSRRNHDAAVFEIGAVFLPDPAGDTNRELETLAGALMGALPGNWLGKAADYDFYHLKGILDNLFKTIGAEGVVYRKESANPGFHPGRAATLVCGDETIGVIGELHPDVLGNFDLPERIVAFELDLEKLYDLKGQTRQYKPLPKFPGIERDLAIVLNKDNQVGDIINTIYGKGGELLKTVEVFDIYQGEQVPPGCQSIAFSLSFQASDRTMTDAEISEITGAIAEELTKTYQAQLRS